MPAPQDAQAARAIIDFWFSDYAEDRWFRIDPDFDRDIADRFGALYERAASGELSSWLKSAETALALAILLDQIPRNIFRGTPRAFESGDQALEVSRIAITNAYDQQRSTRERTFFYLPLMHSEDMLDQTECVQHYRRLNDAESLRFAEEHRDIIARFGRFPHRNAVLGRKSTEEESEFLETHSGF
jgi:uncharacterized protein (DUF924 family)